MQVNGRCHCGAVSFTALIDPSKVLACHCSDCQMFSGAPFRAVVPANVADVVLQGQPATYVKVAASGNPRVQAFCGTCGTQLYAAEPEAPKVLNLRLGCLAERAGLPPQRHIWGDSAMPWLHDTWDQPMHPQGPGSAPRQA
jgi:hypothetical protein